LALGFVLDAEVSETLTRGQRRKNQKSKIKNQRPKAKDQIR
jgi:hypothetical protein